MYASNNDVFITVLTDAIIHIMIIIIISSIWHGARVADTIDFHFSAKQPKRFQALCNMFYFVCWTILVFSSRFRLARAIKQNDMSTAPMEYRND